MEDTASFTANQVDVALPENRIAAFFRRFNVTMAKRFLDGYALKVRLPWRV